ncbi:hypothetical protein B7H23_06330 [Notoacmeibacter marinus]|uniref:HTH cro/C1-type domain-containing protein n=1 Tax=Notoacmeibacter marinus TaxID=1876515 RepID=A0A231V3B7_9HYPH|nr:ImmA/IrrE family metallo-endopeptidase [Notoacmeibacter marinus]OXT02511.1 hypothetical protein B7H23_06330 [Notoacmeibacter marinus]
MPEFLADRLVQAAELRGYTTDELPAVGGFSPARLPAILNGDRSPTARQIRTLAEQLAVSPVFFFSKRMPPPEIDLVDFRSADPAPFRYRKNTKLIARQLKFARFIAGLRARVKENVASSPPQRDDGESAPELSERIRKLLSIDDISSISSDRRDYFRNLRSAIESQGVIVVIDHNIEENIDGFAYSSDHENLHFVYINTRSRSDGRKNFTLLHEYGHILNRKSGVSNDYQSDNRFEKFNNIFAAETLIPVGQLNRFIADQGFDFDKSKDNSYIVRRIADRFHTSYSAAYWKCAEEELISQEEARAFISNNRGRNSPDSEKNKQGGGPEDGPDQGVIARALIGNFASDIIARSIRSGVASPIEISEATGLSKVRINGIVKTFVEVDR